jgi:hypothetical protein
LVFIRATGFVSSINRSARFVELLLIKQRAMRDLRLRHEYS